MANTEINDRNGDSLDGADHMKSERMSEPTAASIGAVAAVPKTEAMTEEEALEAKDASADRRREELKRTLQAQERAPAKRKKRF